MSDHPTKTPNHLIHESSPYLLQHAYNPVDWYPWGEVALKKARQENKLILVSIGYAACHWCHVMERESFEDKKVAAYMNDHFVCIKVDREERPDIDQIYMDAVQILTGRGGWPLNCVALPDGRPLYGATYFPKKRWMEFMQYMVEFVRDDPNKASRQADLLTEGVRKNDMVSFQSETAPHQMSDLEDVFSKWKEVIDFEKGGNRGNIKFALPVAYEYLLQYYQLSGDKEALKAVTVTLDHMASGGIYDQVGGGFARYSTDRIWKVPHFEKMLYDNAQLVCLYSHAYQVTQKDTYRRIVEETLDFIQREMTDDSGGFYSSLDADSEGVEGRFYVWEMTEMEVVLGDDAPMVCDFYQVTEEGNWEGSNILQRPDDEEYFARQNKLKLPELQHKIESANSRLLEARSQRIRPALDDKVLSAWNGMMMQAYAVAYRVFGHQNYLEIAIRSGDFLLEKMKREDGGLYRNYKGNRASINGFLDDYAFVISGFVELYQASFDEKWLYEADRLIDYALAHFYDDTSQMFFYTSDLDPALVARKMEVADNVIPSSNSQMARNLFVLGHYFYREDYLTIARQMVNNVKSDAILHGPYYANWDVVLSWLISPPYEVAIVGEDWEDLRVQWNRNYLPFVFVSGGEFGGSLELLEHKYQTDATMIYVCQDKVCQKPVTSVEEALDLLSP